MTSPKKKPIKSNDLIEKDIIHAFLQSKVAICILRGSDYIIEFANDLYLQIHEADKSVIGKPLLESGINLIYKSKSLLDKICREKKTYYISEKSFFMVKKGIKKEHFFNCEFQPIKENNTKNVGLIVMLTEVTDLLLAKKQNKILHEKLTSKLIIADKELHFQNQEKEKRANELSIAKVELNYQNEEKEKRIIEKNELESYSNSLRVTAQYARSLIEASNDPMITIDFNGKIMDVNMAMLVATGKDYDTILGTDFYLYFTEKQKAKDIYKQVFKYGFIKDYPLTLKNDHLTDVLFNGSVYKDESGTTIGVVVVARDITQQKLLEKELTEAKIFAELASLLAENAKVLAESATTKAESAVRSKQQFLSNMSHEIRTPMNAIIGFTKVVLKTELTAKQKEYITAIKMSGDALIVLINDILDLAKVDAGKMTFEKTPFKLHLSIAAMMHVFETKIQEKNLKLILNFDENIPEILVGDAVRLHQIILNLMSNAIKFTNKGGVTVSVDLVSENEKEVAIQFTVTDTGIGINMAKTEQIFENFQQATSSTSRLFGGTGLGLAIVKQLVEAQNGTIEVKSIVDVGSTFSFLLNFEKTTINTLLEPEIMEYNTDIKNTKILVVEDMELNQLLMKTLLDDFGFECEIASNGKLAVEKMQTKTYDIVLMDLQMPDMNGFEATEYIRKTLKSNIPIIALTADVTTVDVTKCREVGMDDYISKPVDERLLYSKLMGIIKKPVVIIEQQTEGSITTQTIKYIDLSYLKKITKSNPAVISEIIEAYLKQTPNLINSMKKSLKDKDWQLLKSTIHKMIPSFNIMGINKEFEQIALQIHDYAHTIEQSIELTELVLKLENVFNVACQELQNELIIINKTK